MQTYTPRKYSRATYIFLGIFALLPVLGVIQSFILLILCILNGINRGFLIIAVIGIFSSVFAWSFLKYQSTHRGIYDDIRIMSAQNSMHTIIKELEIYKLNKGEYPPDLNSLSKVARISIEDPIQTVHPDSKNTKFFFKLKSPRQYYLFSNGFDGKSFTPDDIMPSFQNLDLKKLGWISPDSLGITSIN